MRFKRSIQLKTVAPLLIMFALWAADVGQGSAQNPAALFRTGQSIRIFFSGAKTAKQFSNVYKTSATMAQLGKLTKGAETIAALGQSTEGYSRFSPKVKFWENQDQISQFWNTQDLQTGNVRTRKTKSRASLAYDIVIGHSMAGRLILPDGESIDIATLASIAQRNGRTLVVVSCHAKEWLPSYAAGTSRAITYKQAAAITEDVLEFLSEREKNRRPSNLLSEIEIANLQHRIDKSETWHLLKPRFTVRTVIASGTGAAITYLIVERVRSNI